MYTYIYNSFNDNNGLHKHLISLNCYYEEKDSIGKRYRRQDAIGTPFCITVDHNTLEDDSVTFRNRDDMSQERVKIKFLNEFINTKLLII